VDDPLPRALSHRNAQSIHVLPVLTWVLIQLAALGLGASGLPLWAHHPLPRESIAVDEMAAIQIAGAAMLFPVLLVNTQTALLIALLVWPFLHLAGLLSGTPEEILLLVCAAVSIWITGLGFCNARLRSPSTILRAVCVAQLFSIGGGLLWYLYLESRGGGSAPAELFGPLVAAIQLINGSTRYWLVFAEASLPLLIGVASAMRIRFKPSSATG
jgi:hypothetical protein